jgi:hypothetical protein
MQDIPDGVIRPQMHIYSVTSHTQQEANCKHFLATSFGSKIQPLSGHYTRTEKQKTLEVTAGDLSLHIRNTLQMYLKQATFT